jgi:hypothetical protein
LVENKAVGSRFTSRSADVGIGVRDWAMGKKSEEVLVVAVPIIPSIPWCTRITSTEPAL